MSNMLLNRKELLILGEFSSDYHGRIYGRDLAKKLGMNQKTVSNILNELEKENILKFSFEGRNKHYYLNEFNPYIKEIIKLIEVNKKIKLLERFKNNKLIYELERTSEGILILFGSYAKGDNVKGSDLDIFVIGKVGDVSGLEKNYRIKINVVKSNKSKFDKDSHLIKEIVKNHIVLKGVEEFVDLIW